MLSVSLLVVFGYGWYNYRALNSGLQRLGLHNLGDAAPNGVPAGGSSGSVHGKTQNILIVGVDSRAGLSPAEQRKLHVGSDQSMSTDSIMVIHVPADGSKATMISIPRDSYVDIPDGYLKNKINAAFGDAYADAHGSEKQREAAGADLLIATVKKLTGLSIDHYVQVSFEGFYTIAKAIGKIPVNLCHSVDDSYAHNQAEGQTGGSGFVMSAGHHDLNAVQALEFVRQRHNLPGPGNDLGRVARQRYFLTAAFHKIESVGVLANPIKLQNLIDAIKTSFTIDQDFSLQALAEQMIDLNANNIVGVTIPTDGSATVSIAGQSEDVEMVTPSKVQAKIRQVLSGQPATPKKHSNKPKHKAIDKGCIN
jgi:LCP family protein required for cell wall assembly